MFRAEDIPAIFAGINYISHARRTPILSHTLEFPSLLLGLSVDVVFSEAIVLCASDAYLSSFVMKPPTACFGLHQG